MKIGVIADTHSLDIPDKVLKAFKNVDVICHAGDFCSVDELNIFKDIKDVHAVYGNCDDSDLVKALPEKIIIAIDGLRVGMFHGEGSAKTVLESVKRKFIKDKVDVVIFGHSHQAFNKVIDGTLFFNPGSPNDTITAPFCSYGQLEITNGNVFGKIIKL
ncbi:MAG: putative phosphoesterase [Lysobacterales bacterium]|jgi:putative phosphoesterase